MHRRSPGRAIQATGGVDGFEHSNGSALHLINVRRQSVVTSLTINRSWVASVSYGAFDTLARNTQLTHAASRFLSVFTCPNLQDIPQSVIMFTKMIFVYLLVALTSSALRVALRPVQPALEPDHLPSTCPVGELLSLSNTLHER